MAAPTALEPARIHVVYQHALGIHDVHLVRVFIQIEEKDAARENVRVLIVLLYWLRFFSWCGPRPRWPKSHKKFPSPVNFCTLSPRAEPREPDISFAIHHDAVLGLAALTRIAQR